VPEKVSPNLSSQFDFFLEDDSIGEMESFFGENLGIPCKTNFEMATGTSGASLSPTPKLHSTPSLRAR
jgi:hypothetical protein